LAKYQSLDALNAKQQFRASFWEYKSFKGDYLPQLKLNATVPDLQRVIQTMPVLGIQTYVPQQYIQYSADLD